MSTKVTQLVLLMALALNACGHAEADSRVRLLMDRQDLVLARTRPALPESETLRRKRDDLRERLTNARARLHGDLPTVRTQLTQLGCQVEGENPITAVCPTRHGSKSDVHASTGMYAATNNLFFDDLRVLRFRFIRSEARFTLVVEKRPLPIAPPFKFRVMPEIPTQRELAEVEADGPRLDLLMSARSKQAEIDEHAEQLQLLREVDIVSREFLEVLEKSAPVVDGEFDLEHLAYETLLPEHKMLAEDFEFILSDDGTEVSAWCNMKEGAEEKILERLRAVKNASIRVTHDGPKLFLTFVRQPPEPP